MINKKIIFMGTPFISTAYLNALIEKKINIDAVFTQPPKKQLRGMKLTKSPIHILANEKKISVFHPERLDLQVINQLKIIKPDLIIVMAYGKLIPKEILELPRCGCINIHVSILPRWRGAAPIEYTLLNGDKQAGVSIIKLNEKLDAGPIIIQKKINVPENFNKLRLSEKLTKIGKKLLVDTLPSILENKVILKDQDENKVTYANKITSEDRKINFYNTTKNVINHIRAHGPKPGAWFHLNNERIKILEAKANLEIGNISTILNKNFVISCQDGSIEPLILQREGKKIVTKDEFVRGFNFKVGNLVNA